MLIFLSLLAKNNTGSQYIWHHPVDLLIILCASHVSIFDHSRHLCRGYIILHKIIIIVKWLKALQERQNITTIAIPVLGLSPLCPVTVLRAYMASVPKGPKFPSLLQLQKAILFMISVGLHICFSIWCSNTGYPGTTGEKLGFLIWYALFSGGWGLYDIFVMGWGICLSHY